MVSGKNRISSLTGTKWKWYNWLDEVFIVHFIDGCRLHASFYVVKIPLIHSLCMRKLNLLDANLVTLVTKICILCGDGSEECAWSFKIYGIRNVWLELVRLDDLMIEDYVDTSLSSLSCSIENMALFPCTCDNQVLRFGCKENRCALTVLWNTYTVDESDDCFGKL